MKILCTQDLKEEYLEEIKHVVPDAQVVKALDVETQEREIVDSDVLLTFGRFFKMDLLYEANNLRWIQSWSAGVDPFTRPEILKFLIDNEIKLTTTSGIHANVIAEQVIGFMVSFSRQLYRFYEQQKNQQWQKVRVDQLEGRTLAVIGTGSIGQEIAARGKAFKMRTIGVKRDTSKPVEYIDELYSPDELFTVLRQADYVVVIVPLTDETSQMFGVDEFRAMKNTAYFINMARGGVVDEKALISALQNGWIAGAGLDVFEKEPLPADSPLYKLDNVLITPHTAGIFPDYNKKATEVFVDNLKRYKEGRKLINLVDYNKGY